MKQLAGNSIESSQTSFRLNKYKNIDEIYLAAWKKTAGMKNVFWHAFISIILIYFIISYTCPIISGIVTNNYNALASVINHSLHICIILFLITPLLTGLLMISMQHCADTPTPVSLLFQYLCYWKRLWVYPAVYILLNLISNVIPDNKWLNIIMTLLLISWTVTYFIFIPLTVEKHMDIISTLKLSHTIILNNAMKVLRFILLGFIIFIASILTGGIAFIWTLPWILNAISIFYQEIVGLQMSLV